MKQRFSPARVLTGLTLLLALALLLPDTAAAGEAALAVSQGDIVFVEEGAPVSAPLVGTVAAADPVTLTVAQDTAAGTVTVTGKLSARLTNCGGFVVELTYNKDVFTLAAEDVKVAEGVGIAAVNADTPGTCRIGWVCDTANSSLQELFTATFATVESVNAIEDCEFKATVTDMVDNTKAVTSISGYIGKSAAKTVRVIPAPTWTVGGEPKLISGPKISMQWSDVEDAESYTVYSQIKGSDEWRKETGIKGTNGTNEYEYTDVAIGQETTYRFKVCAVDGEGTEGKAIEHELTFDLPLLSAPPITVTSTWAVGKDTPMAKISWNTITYGNESVTVSYQLYRREEGGAWEKLIDYDYDGYVTGAYSFIDDGDEHHSFKSGTTYWYSVRAVANVKLSDDSTIEIPGSFDSAGVEVAVPVLPQPAQEGDTGITLQDGPAIFFQWKTVTGAAGYRVYRSVDEGGKELVYELTDDSTGQALSFEDTDLPLDGVEHSYEYYVYAVNAQGEQGDCLHYAVKTKLPGSLAAPQGLTVKTVGSTGAALYFDDNASLTYRFYVEDTLVEGVTKTEDGTWPLTTLEPNTTYVVRVYPVVDGLAGPPAAVTFTTLHPQVSGVGAVPQADDSDIFNNKIAVSWTGQEGFDGYLIFRNGVQVHDAGEDALAWTDTVTTAVGANTFAYTVRGYVTENGQRAYGEESAPVEVVCTIPDAPVITGIVGTGVALAESVTNALIDYQVVGDSAWTTGVERNDLALGAGEKYNIRARAYNTHEDYGDIKFVSPYSAVFTGVCGDVKSPFDLTLSLVKGGTAVRVNWTIYEESVFDGYAVFVNGTQMVSMPRPTDRNSTTMEWLMADAVPGKRYYFEVKGYLVENGRAVINVTNRPDREYTIPEIKAVSDLKADAAAGPTLTWKPVTVTGFDTVYYEVSRIPAGARAAEVVAKEVEDTTYTDTSASPVTYTYQVRPYVVLTDNTYYYGPYAQVEKVAAGGFGNDAAVKNVTATPTDAATIKLTWDKLDGAKGYEVSRNGELLKEVTANSFDDKDVTQGESYTYTVRAYYEDGSGNKRYSQQGTATGIIHGVAEPDVAYTSTTTSITLTITAQSGDTSKAAEGYTVNLVEGTKKTKKAELTPSDGSASVTVTGLKPGSSYTFEIVGWYEVAPKKQVSHSIEVEGETDPVAQVTGVTAEPYSYDTAKETGSILVTWTQPEGAEGYKVTITDGTGHTETATISKGTTTSHTFRTCGKEGAKALSIEAGVEYTVTVTPTWKDKSGATREGTSSVAETCTIPDPEELSITELEPEWNEDKKTLTVTWSSGDVPHGFNIYRVAGTATKSTKWTLVHTVNSASANSWTDTTAELGKTYTYSVRPFYQFADGKTVEGTPYKVGEAEGAAVITGKLAAPASITGKPVDGSTIYVEWPAVAEAASYEVYRVPVVLGEDGSIRMNDKGEFVDANNKKLTPTKAATVTHTAGRSTFYINDSKLKQDTLYHYYVVAKTKTLTSAETHHMGEGEDYSYLVIAAPAPLESKGLTVKTTDKTADLSWTVKFTEGDEPAADGFRIQVLNGKNVVAEKTLTSTELSVIDSGADNKSVITRTYTAEGAVTGLAPDVSYTFEVSSFVYANDGENPYYSAAVKTTQKTAVAPAPENVTVSLTGASSITATWSKVEGVTGYKIYRAPLVESAGELVPGKFAQVGSVTGEGTLEWTDDTAYATSYKEGAVEGYTFSYGYAYKVAAYTGSSSLGAYSDEVETTVLTLEPPTGSSSSAETVDGSTIRIEWELNGGGTKNYISKFEIYRVAEGSSVTSKTRPIATLTDGTVCSYSDSTAKAGEAYAYYVYGYVAMAKESVLVVSASIPEITIPYPDAPLVTCQSLDGPSIKLSWDVEGEDTAGYTVYRDGQPLATVIPLDGEVTYEDKAVTPRKEYKYTVVPFTYSDTNARIYGKSSAELKVKAGYAPFSEDDFQIVGPTEVVAGGEYEYQVVLTDITADSVGLTGGSYAVSGTEVSLNTKTWKFKVKIPSGADSLTVTLTGKNSALWTVSKELTLTIVEKATLELATPEMTLIGGESHTFTYTYLNPGASSKDKIAWTLVNAAEEDGAVVPGTEPVSTAVATINNSNGKLTTKAVDAQTVFYVRLAVSGSDGTLIEDAYAKVTLNPKGSGVIIRTESEGVVASNGVSNVTITRDMSKGSTFTLTAAVVDAAGSTGNVSQSVTWKSSAPKVAAVDEKGRVTMLAPGTATITATADDGSKKSASFKLEVYYLTTSKKLSVMVVPASGGSTASTPVKVDTAGYAAGTPVTFVLVDEYGEVLEIGTARPNKSGIIKVEQDKDTSVYTFTGLAKGSDTLTVTLAGDPLNRKATATIKVVEAGSSAAGAITEFVLTPTGLDFAPDADYDSAEYWEYMETAVSGSDTTKVITNTLYLNYNESLSYVFNLQPATKNSGDDGEYVVIPSGSNKYTWTSSDSKVATVKANNDGTATVTIKAKASGEATITCKINNTVTATITIDVRDYIPTLDTGSAASSTSNKLTINPMQKDKNIGDETTPNMVAGGYVYIRANDRNEVQTDEGSVSLLAYNTKTKQYTDTVTSFAIEPSAGSNEEEYVIYPVGNVTNGTYKLAVVVETGKGTHQLPVEVTVKGSTPRVTVKQGTEKFDLLYTDEAAFANFTFTVADGTAISRVELDSDAFAIRSNVKGNSENPNEITLGWKEGAATAKPNTKVTFKVYLAGYDEPVQVSATVGTTTTKPSLVLSASSGTFRSGGTLMTILSVSTKGTSKVPGEWLPLDGEAYTTADFAHVYRSPDGNLVLTITDTTARRNAAVPIYIKQSNWASEVKLDYKVTVENTAATVTLASKTIKLNLALWQIAEGSTTFTVSQSNQTVTDLTVENRDTLSEDAQKIQLAVEGNSLVVRFAEGVSKGTLPSPGNYKYKVTFLADDGELNTVEVTVNVVNELPKVTLGSATVSMNSALAGQETVTTPLKVDTAECSVSACELVSVYLGKAEQTDAFEVELVGDTLYVKMKKALPKGDYILTITPTVTNNEVEVTAADLTLKVKVAESAYTATVSGKGTLSLSDPDSEILYTLTKLTNIGGTVQGVELVGDDVADKLEVTFQGFDAKGQPLVSVKLKGEGHSSGAKYTFKLGFTLEGMDVLVETGSITVTIGK